MTLALEAMVLVRVELLRQQKQKQKQRLRAACAAGTPCGAESALPACCRA